MISTNKYLNTQAWTKTARKTLQPHAWRKQNLIYHILFIFSIQQHVRFGMNERECVTWEKKAQRTFKSSIVFLSSNLCECSNMQQSFKEKKIPSAHRADIHSSSSYDVRNVIWFLGSFIDFSSFCSNVEMAAFDLDPF